MDEDNIFDRIKKSMMDPVAYLIYLFIVFFRRSKKRKIKEEME